MSESIEHLIKTVLGDEAIEFDYTVGSKRWRGRKRYFSEDSTEGVDLVPRFWRKFHEVDVRLVSGPLVFRTGPKRYAEQVEVDPSAKHYARPPTFRQILVLPGLPVVDVLQLCHVATPYEGSAGAAESFRRSLEEGRRTAPKWMQRGLTNAVIRRFANEGSGYVPRWKRVKRVLTRVQRLAPFEIIAAGSSNLELVFLESPAAEGARELASMLLPLAPETMDVLADEIRAMSIEVPTTNMMTDEHAAMAAYIQSTGRARLWWD